MNKDDIAKRSLSTAKPSPSGNWRGTCYFCPLKGSEDKRKSISFLVASGVYFCWKCKTRGRLGNIPKTFHENNTTIKLSEIDLSQGPDNFYELASGPGATAESLEPARAYLRGRGLKEEMWAEFGIGACTSGPRSNPKQLDFSGRVIIPIKEEGVWKGWISRTWTKRAEIPYLYARGMLRGITIFNVAALYVPSDIPLIVVEGVFDALALWPYSVAVLGNASEPQIDQLIACGKQIAWFSDPDALRGAHANAFKCRANGVDSGVIDLNMPGMDPDEVPREMVFEAAKACIKPGIRRTWL